MTRGFVPRPRRDDLTVLLVADSPAPERRLGDEDPAGRHEALTAIARAVFAAGGRLAMPADAGVCTVMATIGLEYGPARVAERLQDPEPPRLLVMETIGPHRWSRRLLASHVARGVVQYLDVEGTPVLEDLGIDDADLADLPEQPRQPVSPALLQTAEPTAAILLSSAPSAAEDLRVLRAFGVPTSALRFLAQDRETEAMLAEVDDPSERLLGDTRRSRWRDRPRDADPDAAPFDAPAAVPYAFVMQQLVEEWTNRSSGPPAADR